MPQAESIVFHLRAAATVWTGTAPQEQETRLRLSGLLGGIRWWAEAVVRGAGGYACDPTVQANRCATLADACVICRLFGSSGLKGDGKDAPLAAKFMLRAWDQDPRTAREQEARTSPLETNAEFFLEFYFPRQRLPTEAERYLLLKTMEVIVGYGSVGARTTLKPSNGPNAGLPRHQDYGILAAAASLPPPSELQKAAFRHACSAAGKTGLTGWPDLRNFWFVKNVTIFDGHRNHAPDGMEEPDTFNGLLGLARMNGLGMSEQCAFHDGLDCLREDARGLPEDAGHRSKRVFSFKNPARSWGYFSKPFPKADIERWLGTVGITPTQIEYGSGFLT